MEPSMDPGLITRTLNFHGQQLQKIWEAERGEADLAKHRVNTTDVDFSIYIQRQKHLSFQDRGKRLKLQQFIVKKATGLFDTAMLEQYHQVKEKNTPDEDYYAMMPPYELFLSLDKQSRQKHFFQILKKGDIVIGSVSSKSVSGMMLKILCSSGENARCVSELNIKAFVPMSSIIQATDKLNVVRTYMLNDTVGCEVLEVIPESDKLVCGMMGETLPSGTEVKLGLVHSDEFPDMYNIRK